MRHPFWILNSSLLLLLLVCTVFIFFTGQTLPKKMSRHKKITIPQLFVQDDTEPIAISKIYENDLFNTYHEKISPPTEPDYAKPIPTPPAAMQAVIPEDPIVPFLPPLTVTLKGIMIVNDESNNAIIIEDASTKKETNYKVGDMIEDAQLIRILNNKAILVRSNGQFETLYLSENDIFNQAAIETEANNWQQLVVKSSETLLEVDPVSFAELIPGLPQLIDTFDISTTYKKGSSVGCRIGKIASGSMAQALGFEAQDIVTHIAGIETSTSEKRLEIFNKLKTFKLSDSFTIDLERNGQSIKLKYLLTDLKDPLFHPSGTKNEDEDNQKVGIFMGPSSEELENERVQLLKERYKFAPTAQDILLEQRKLINENESSIKNVSLLNE